MKKAALETLPGKLKPFEPVSGFDFHNVIYCFVDQDQKDTVFVGMDGNGCKYFNMKTHTKTDCSSLIQSKR